MRRSPNVATAVRLKPDLADGPQQPRHRAPRTGKLDEAIAEFREAIRLKPGLPRGPLTTSASPCQPGEAGRGDRRVPRSAPPQARVLRKPTTTSATALSEQGKLDEAIAEYREAMRLKPDLAEAHTNLGIALLRPGEAGRGDRRAPRGAAAQARLRRGPQQPRHRPEQTRGSWTRRSPSTAKRSGSSPTDSDAHNNLGIALRDQGKLDEAIAELPRRRSGSSPTTAEAHNNLGNRPADRGSWTRRSPSTARRSGSSPTTPRPTTTSATPVRPGQAGRGDRRVPQAIRLKPDYAEAHCNLGDVLLQQGRLRRGTRRIQTGSRAGLEEPELASSLRGVGAARPSGWSSSIASCRRSSAVSAKPADAAESLGFAQICYDKKLHGASARSGPRRSRLNRSWPRTCSVQNRYNAACAAALAGSGQGKDDPPLDDDNKGPLAQAGHRLAQGRPGGVVEDPGSGPPQARQVISQTLQHWKADTDLAGLRDAAALAKLPEDEQKACRDSGPGLMRCWRRPRHQQRINDPQEGEKHRRTEPAPTGIVESVKTFWPARQAFG